MKLLDNATLTELLATAADSPRRRANHNIHPLLEDPVQRGALALLVFGDRGRVEERQRA